jgi:D-xylose transport system substrate-binding protein
MKKYFALVTVVMLTVTMLAGCATGGVATPAASGAPSVEASATAVASTDQEGSTQSSDKEKITVGVSFGTLQEERWEAERVRMVERADELDNVDLIYTDANHDAAQQNSQIENMISQGIDVLVIGPQDTEAAAVAVASAKKAGIPVVSYCRVVNSPDLDVIVSYDYVAIGEENMKLALQAVPEGNYALVNGHVADSVPHDENTGYHKVIDEYVNSGAIKVVYDDYINNWSPDEAMAAVENLLTKYDNDIQAIICNNDGMAGGAVQALIGQGLQGKVYVAGMDAELAACQRVAEGTQTVTVLTGYDQLADAVFDAAVQLAYGEELTGINAKTEVSGAEIPTIQVSPVFITKDNIYDEIVAKGFRSIEDVYANVPKDQWPAQ